MSNKEGTVIGGIIKLILFCVIVIIICSLSFMEIYPRIKSTKQKRAKEKSTTSMIEITYIGGGIDTIQVEGKSFFIDTYKQAVPVLKKSIFGGNVAVNVQNFKIIKQWEN